MIEWLTTFKIYFPVHTEHSMGKEAEWDLRIDEVTISILDRSRSCLTKSTQQEEEKLIIYSLKPKPRLIICMSKICFLVK